MIWYPYEQLKTMKPPYKVIDAKGVHLYTEDNDMIDSVSSWWSTIYGYKNEKINASKKVIIRNAHHLPSNIQELIMNEKSGDQHLLEVNAFNERNNSMNRLGFLSKDEVTIQQLFDSLNPSDIRFI